MLKLDLDIGCIKHPKYTAKKKPAADCVTCQKVWGIAQLIRGPHQVQVMDLAVIRGKIGSVDGKVLAASLWIGKV